MIRVYDHVTDSDLACFDKVSSSWP